MVFLLVIACIVVCIQCMNAAESVPYILIDDSEFSKSNSATESGIRYFQEIGDGGNWFVPTQEPPQDTVCSSLDFPCHLKHLIQTTIASESLLTLLSYLGVAATCIIAVFSVRDHYDNRECFRRYSSSAAAANLV
eukprot:Gregarina_sp_Poly_1__1079@NODE_1264_length_4570_cov_95_245614_g859_i0_p7_GENE_NODE_1264_length_4570_cov_95_245614_g859_i0NODE_1264_length_4570_cov_95_245614_g859_i0_p7_ORF_typecomplete_len135_score11_83Guanylin/PF02058_15/0_049_NODE_1264_length_4570_cov_95_245614_g859_i012141618